jgi:hypothetical protein
LSKPADTFSNRGKFDPAARGPDGLDEFRNFGCKSASMMVSKP